jgi:chromosome partitioning protein
MTKHIYAIINQKGGVGKSTIAVNFAFELATKGKKTLLIDLDPQAHSSCIFCRNVDKDFSVATLFREKKGSITPLIQSAYLESERFEFLDIVPSTIHLALVVEQAAGRLYKEKILKLALKEVGHIYDYIVLDCPPNLGVLTINAIFAADTILIPTNYGKYSLDGIADLLHSIHEIKEDQEYKYFIIRNLFERRNSQTNRFINEQLKQVDENLLDTIIRKTEAINQSQINSVPVRYFSPTSHGAHDFYQLTMEILANGS